MLFVDLTFQLSNPQGSPSHAPATATVGSVQAGPDATSPPSVDQQGTISLDGGVVTEGLDNTTYCNYSIVSYGTCGA